LILPKVRFLLSSKENSSSTVQRNNLAIFNANSKEGKYLLFSIAGRI